MLFSGLILKKKKVEKISYDRVQVLPICYACKNYIGSFEQIHCK